MADTGSASRVALHELIATLREIDETVLGPAWGITAAEDVGEGVRAVMHLLEAALATQLESDPLHPEFRRIVLPSRKLTGDNADAIYFDAPVRDDAVYRVRGNTAGAVYVSISVEAAAADGGMGSGTVGVINDTQFDVAPDGSFEITVGGPPAGENHLALPQGASRLTTRHYFERPTSAAADPSVVVPMHIELIGDAPPPVFDDATTAAGIRRVANFVRTRTLGLDPPGQRTPPAFVSQTPNVFPAPIKPGDFALAAADAAYSMGPFVLGPDEALVVKGRWPECRSANVCLWNRHMQTFDYVHRQTSLNRAQTTLDDDGGFTMVIAPRDPGCPNWLDSEGRAFGMVFWRFMLPEGPIETPVGEVVPLTDLARR